MAVRDPATGALLFFAAPVDAELLREGEDALRAAIPQGLSSNAELAPLTSFQIGGRADLLLDPPSEAALAKAMAIAHRLGLPATLLGGGTNILVADRGVRGLVLRLGKVFRTASWTENGDGTADVEVGASYRLIRLAKESVERGYGGLEFAAGIPGSVGGGTCMNAGAFGGEIGNAIQWVRGVAADGRVVTYRRPELQFSYRRLALPGSPMLTSICFRLVRSPVGKLKGVVERVQAKRRRGQPAGFPNAGSIFKNPQHDFAGRLIERVGLKGTMIGGAQISSEHANFIVNVGGATAANVYDLMGRIQDGVWQRCGIWLEPEIRLVGEWE